MNAGSGQTLTALAANPVYTNAGEIPMTRRGDGFETVDGFKTRTPAEFTVDLHTDYRFDLGPRRVLLVADVFNVFNRRVALDYDNWFETTLGAVNPNFGYPTAGGGASTASFQPPLSVRLGARFDW